MLRLEGITAAYGPILALRDVSLEVEEGSVVTLLGANGAGKTSTLRVISGLLRPQAGRVELAGERIDHLSPSGSWPEAWPTSRRVGSSSST